MPRRGRKLIVGMSEEKVKNVLVAGGLSAFVASAYVFTLKAVGGTDELQAAVETFEREEATRAHSAS
ncbi:hypothetical protein R1flu_013218 [Riccia fluitans]|uniref:Uncharacterized protein n=1 Tax=Riccia fluitans TaxID=41844 RepID=A0ABD1YCR3_9MARC